MMPEVCSCSAAPASYIGIVRNVPAQRSMPISTSSTLSPCFFAPPSPCSVALWTLVKSWTGSELICAEFEKRHLGTGIEDEDEPSLAIDHAAHGGAEVIPEKILIGRGDAIRGGEVRERGLVAAEVELDARLLQQVRAEEELDRELVLAGDDELHLVVRHDRHRHVLDGHLADLQRLDDSELDLNRLAEEAGERPFEVAELADGNGRRRTCARRSTSPRRSRRWR